MKTKKERLIGPGLLAALLLPLVLVGLFYLVIQNRAWINGWVFGVMAPLEQALGRFWSLLPFSVAEVLTALFLTGSVVWSIWTAGAGPCLRLALAVVRPVLALERGLLRRYLCPARRAGDVALFGGRAGFRHGLFCQAGGRPV